MNGTFRIAFRAMVVAAMTLLTGSTATAQVHVKGNVFGGGNLAEVGGSVTVNIKAGTVDNDVYGGGALANTNTNNWNAYEPVSGLTVGTSVVTGLYIKSGESYTEIAEANKTAEENTKYYKKVGAWADGMYNTTTGATYNTTTVNLTGGTINGNAYGGGLGQKGVGSVGDEGYLKDIPAYVYGDVTVKLNEGKTANKTGCIVTKVFGCNNLNGTPKGHVKVYVYATQNKANTTIGSNKTENGRHSEMEGEGVATSYDVEAVYGGGNLSPYEPVDAYSTDENVKKAAKTEVYISGCDLTSIKQVYGGGNAASAPATNVYVDGAYEIEELFGGGNGKDDYVLNGKYYDNPGANVGYTNYTHLNGEGTGDQNSPYICVDNDDATTKAGRQTEANGYMYGSGVARIEVFGGIIHASYGGSNTKGNIRVKASSKYEESGGCGLQVTETYGGGKDSDIDGEIDLNLGCVTDMTQIFGGSKNANVYSDIVLNINNGTYHQVFGGNNTSGNIYGSITVNIEENGCVPIEIDELYIGGYLANYSVYGYNTDKSIKTSGDRLYNDPRLNVISASRIDNIFGGGYKATVVGNPHVNINMEAGKVEVTKMEKTEGDDATYAFEEDSKTYVYKDDNGTIYDKNKVTQVSTKYYASLPLGTITNVYGGGNEADIIGDTYVEIGTGKWIDWDASGKEIWKSKDKTDGNIYIYKVKTAATETTPAVWAWYDGDTEKDTDFTPAPARNSATITGDVFGGGNGKIDDEATALVHGDTYVTISGVNSESGTTKTSTVTIGRSVYGGGKLAQVGGNTNITFTGGIIGTTGEGGATYGNIYGGGFGTATYGNGTDVATKDNYKLFGRIKGNANVKISGGDILHNVYGGGAYGSVGEFDYDATTGMPTGRKASTTGGIANVTITGGTIGTTGQENGMVFGSSRGNVATPVDNVDPNDRLAWVFDANVVIGTSGATTGPQIYGSLYGSGENGHAYNNTEVTLYSGIIGVTVASEATNVTEDGKNYSGAAYPYRGNVYGGGCGTDTYKVGSVDTFNPLAGVVYGNATITMTGGHVAHNVYGAGAMGSVGTTTKDNDNHLVISSGGTTTIAISGGTVGVDGTAGDGNVFGAARGNETTTQTGIALVKTTGVTISGTAAIKGNVYGGGALGDVGTYYTVTETGNDKGNNIYLGGDASGVCTVVVSGGTIGTEGNANAGHVFGAGKGESSTYTCQKAMVKGTTVAVSNGTIYGNVYGGGEVGRVEHDAVVTIGLEQVADGTTTYYDKQTDGTYSSATVTAGTNVVGKFVRLGVEGSYVYIPIVESDRPIIHGNVFGAGAGLETHGYSALVRGNSTVAVQGYAQVRKNVYGGGEKATVGKYWVSEFSEDPNNHAPEGYPSGMPYATRDGGLCTVAVRGHAAIGPETGDASETAGHVFGAGKGVEPTSYTFEGTDKPSRMNNGGMETLNDKSAYFQFLETLALVSNTVVSIGGNAAVKGSVFGGSESGFVQDHTSVTIAKGEIGTETSYGNVFGGGKGLLSFAEAGRVRGNTTLTINDGVIRGNVYGGGRLGDVGTIDKTDQTNYNYKWKKIDGTTANDTEINKKTDLNTNTGICTVTISGGTIGLASTSEPTKHGNVFGAGRGSDITWWCEKAIAYATDVSISAGTVYGTIYGGGEVGRVEDDAKVTIGTENETAGNKPTITGSVFGAGAGLHTHGYSALVRGNTNVTVQGSAQVGGSVYGGGETASVGKFTVVGGLPKHPDSGGYCTVMIQDNAKIGSSGTGHNVYGACKGIDPAAISAAERKSMQLFKNRPKDANGNYKPENEGWSYYPSNHDFIWVTYTDDDYPTFLRTLALTSHPHVTIAEEARVYGSVYGGGQRGITLGNVDVDITGGTVEQDVYGGGALADTNTGNWDADSYTEVTGLTTGASVSGLYTRTGSGTTDNPYQYTIASTDATYDGSTTYYSKGKWADATLKTGLYKTTVDLTGGYIKGDAYGGGLGQKDGFNGKSGDIAAVVHGDIRVNLGSSTSGSSATSFLTSYYTGDHASVVKSGRVFGCNNLLGSPKGNVTVTVYKTVAGKDGSDNNLVRTTEDAKTSNKDIKTAHPEDYESVAGYVTPTYEVAAVYGGGNLADFTTNGKKANVVIETCDVSVKSVYGGGNAAEVPGTDVLVKGAWEIQEVFGGGNGKDPYTNGSDWLDNPGANIGNSITPGDANTLLTGGLVHEAYGGSNEKGTIFGNVQIDLGTGGACTLDVEKMVGAGKNADVNGNLIMILGCKPNEKVPALYAGADQANVNGNVELTITSGRFEKVFGGNNLSGAIRGHIKLNIEETGDCETPIIIDKLYLGGNEAPYSRYGYYVETTKTGGTPVGAPDETAVLTSAGKLHFIPRESANDTHLPVKSYSYDETNGWTWTVYTGSGEGNVFTPYAQPELNIISCTRIDEVFGGGYGETAIMYCDPVVNINMIQGSKHSGVPAVMTDLTLSSTDNPSQLGIIGDVYGGGDAAPVYGNTTVNIGAAENVLVKSWNYDEETKKYTASQQPVLGAYIRGSVFGGGKLADVGKTHLETVDGATVDKIDIKGNTHVNIGARYNEDSQKWESVDGLAVTIGGNVYGGGQGEDLASGDGAFRCGKAMITESTNVIIGNGTVGTLDANKTLVAETGAVYGGGKVGRVEENTTVTIGIKLGDNETSSTSVPVIYGNVFGAGAGVNTHGYAALVRGTSTVTVQGGAKVKQSVYGGGEIASVGRYAVADAAYHAAHPAVEEGLPYSLADPDNVESGMCIVNVWDKAVIGPDYKMEMTKDGGPDDMGHVFGAGKGVLPYEGYAANVKAWRVIPNNNQETYLSLNDAEGGADEAAYLKFIESMALATETYVTIGGDAFVKGSVYGGSENGHVQFSTHVTIQDNCQIGCGKNTTDRHPDAVWGSGYSVQEGTDLECASWTYDASSGAPYDKFATTLYEGKYYYDASHTKYAEGGSYIAKDGHTYYGNVFGGGSGVIPYRPGKWHREAGSVGRNTTVNITGGHILTSVYGGNEQTDVGAYILDGQGQPTIPAHDGKCTVNMVGGTLGVPRTLAQIAAHPVTCYLFGAGKGDQRVFFNTWTNVIETEVNISGNAHIYGSTFGGGEDGHIIGNSVTNIGGPVTIGSGNSATTYTENGVIIGTTGTSYVDGNVFGGGRGFSGEAQTAGTVGGNVEVNIYGGTMLGSIYGGGRLASVGTMFTAPNDPNYGNFVEDGGGKTYGHVTVNISGGTIGNDEGNAESGNVFGGSMGRLNLLNGNINPIWPKMAQVKETTVTISDNALIKRTVYGGGELGTVRDNTHVTISGGQVNRDVYGGGYGSEEYDVHTIFNVKEPDGSNGYKENSYAFTPMQFAGCVGKSTTVDISGGYIRKSVYGGGEKASVGIMNCLVEEVTSEPGKDKIVVGQSEGKWTIYKNMVKHWDVDNEFALSWPIEFSYVPTFDGATHVNITGGRIGTTKADDYGTDNGDVYGGGKGFAGDYNNYVFCANVGSTEVNIEYPTTADPAKYYTEKVDCIAGAVYGGGENGHVMGDTHVTLTNGLIGHGLYGGGSGKGTFSQKLLKIGATEGSTSEADYYTRDIYSITAGKVFGNTRVDMSGGYVVRNVYGGGTMGSVGKGNYAGGTDDYSTTGYGENAGGNLWTSSTDGDNAWQFLNSGICTVNITGGTVGYTGTKDGLPYGNVFGGCRGEAAPNIVETPRYLYSPEFYVGYANETRVTIGAEGSTTGPRIFGSVYGGGQDGHVRRDAKVTINSGEIGSTYAGNDLNAIEWKYAGNVFGAGSGIGKYQYDFNYDGKFESTVKYNNGRAEVDTKEEDYSTSAGSVTRSTIVEVKGGTIHRTVYGGGSLASVGAPKIGQGYDPYHPSDSEHSSEVGKQSLNKVTISGGQIGDATSIAAGYGGDVNGGSRGELAFVNSLANPSSFANSVWTDVIISGEANILGNVFGGGEAGIVKHDTDVKMQGGTVGNDLYGAGDMADVNGNTTVSLTGGTITHDAYGGARGTAAIAAYVGGDVLVDVNNVANDAKGCIVERVFGANNVNGTPKGHVKVHVHATQNKNTGSVSVKATSGYDVAHVFGGGNASDYVPDAADTKQSTEVIIEGCDLTSIEEVYGGGYGAAVPATDVLIKGTKIINNVFGGGYGAGTDNPGANVGYVTGGSRSPYALGTGKAVVQLMAGTVNNVYGGSNTKGDIRSGSNVTNVANDNSPGCCDKLSVKEIYGGGSQADMFGGTEIVLGCMPDDWIGAIYAGAENANVGNDVSLTLTSGKFGRVFGGNKSGGTIDGYIEVNIEENPECSTPIIIGGLYGGGNEAPYTVPARYFTNNPNYQSPRVNVRAFTSIGNIYGGGFGASATVTGNPLVNINEVQGGREYAGEDKPLEDGTTVKLYARKADSKMGVIGNVFGGGNAAKVIGNTNVMIGTEAEQEMESLKTTDATTGTVTVVKKPVLGADIQGNVYGAGNNAEVTGHTNVVIGKKAE